MTTSRFPRSTAPWFGEPIRLWQDKDGQNVLVRWIQRQCRPVEGLPPESASEVRPASALDGLGLPGSFAITGWCPSDHRTEARCSYVDGVWTDSDFSETQRLADEAIERARVDLLPRSWSRRKYQYVGDGAAAAATTPPGRQIMRRRDIDVFIPERADEVEEPFTNVVVDACCRRCALKARARGLRQPRPVEATGEIRCEQDDDGRWRVGAVSNRSAGY